MKCAVMIWPNVPYDEVDGNASSFADTVEALGLTQHAQFLTHNRNNILDLMINKAITKKLFVSFYQVHTSQII